MPTKQHLQPALKPSAHERMISSCAAKSPRQAGQESGADRACPKAMGSIIAPGPQRGVQLNEVSRAWRHILLETLLTPFDKLLGGFLGGLGYGNALKKEKTRSARPFHAPGVRIGGVDENPYKAPADSPLPPSQKNPRRLLPRWVLLLFLPMLIFVDALAIRHQRAAALAVCVFVILIVSRMMHGGDK